LLVVSLTQHFDPYFYGVARSMLESGFQIREYLAQLASSSAAADQQAPRAFVSRAWSHKFSESDWQQ